MTGCLRAFASGAGIAEVFDHSLEIRPDILAMDELNGFVLSKVTRQDVIMIILDDSESEVCRIWYIDSIALAEKSGLINGPVRGFRDREMCSGDGIIGKGIPDVFM